MKVAADQVIQRTVSAIIIIVFEYARKSLLLLMDNVGMIVVESVCARAKTKLTIIRAVAVAAGHAHAGGYQVVDCLAVNG